MKIFIFIFLVIFSFFGCNENKIFEPENGSEPTPPKQIGFIDLIGFYNQEIHAVAVNPSEPWNILVSAYNGFNDKLYVTNDYGKNWKISFDSLGTACFEWHPTLSSIAFVAKTAPLSKKQRNNLTYTNPFLYKSTNKGQNWIVSDSGIGVLFDDNISSIKFDYYNSNQIFLNATHHILGMPGEIASWGYCYTSNNGGKSFSDEVYYNLKNSAILGPTTYLLDIEFSNRLPNLIFGAVYNRNGYDLAISSDFGINWSGKKVEDGDDYFDKIKVKNNLILLRGGNFSKTSWLKAWELTTTENSLYISKDFGNSFSKVSNVQLNYSKVNDIVITPDEVIIFTCNLMTEPSKSVIYISKDKGETWQMLGNDYDSKTILAYDSKNKFLYFVKDKENKGLYRIKLN